MSMLGLQNFDSMSHSTFEIDDDGNKCYFGKLFYPSPKITKNNEIAIGLKWVLLRPTIGNSSLLSNQS